MTKQEIGGDFFYHMMECSFPKFKRKLLIKHRQNTHLIKLKYLRSSKKE